MRVLAPPPSHVAALRSPPPPRVPRGGGKQTAGEGVVKRRKCRRITGTVCAGGSGPLSLTPSPGEGEGMELRRAEEGVYLV